MMLTVAPARMLSVAPGATVTGAEAAVRLMLNSPPVVAPGSTVSVPPQLVA